MSGHKPFPPVYRTQVIERILYSVKHPNGKLPSQDMDACYIVITMFERRILENLLSAIARPDGD